MISLLPQKGWLIKILYFDKHFIEQKIYDDHFFSPFQKTFFEALLKSYFIKVTAEKPHLDGIVNASGRQVHNKRVVPTQMKVTHHSSIWTLLQGL